MIVFFIVFSHPHFLGEKNKHDIVIAPNYCHPHPMHSGKLTINQPPFKIEAFAMLSQLLHERIRTPTKGDNSPKLWFNVVKVWGFRAADSMCIWIPIITNC